MRDVQRIDGGVRPPTTQAPLALKNKSPHEKKTKPSLVLKKTITKIKIRAKETKFKIRAKETIIKMRA